ncbi:ABC transporter ATP-binding protein [Microtetraspora malaysiensis]|uniref:ABC transporter ATP-binding protein n=1 Tax=Microtetraspora malaysiensis TaxID=161358 RepID=UPI000A6B9187|nr:ABC transporter ATP-binding protein [Microtetraspora malaysiensis]
MAWRAGTASSSLIVLVTLVSAVVPVSAAWLTKLILDGIVEGSSVSGLIVLAVVLAVLGLLTAAMGDFAQYARGKLARAVAALAQNRLYAAVNRLPGLARFESPEFLDRLRLAQQAGGQAPSQVVENGLAIVAGLITVIGFSGSLFLLSPVMAGIVLVAALPALTAEIALSQRRTTMALRLSPTDRREFFYSRLMSDVQAAMEIRLLGISSFLHGRMMAARRYADDERTSLDRREMRVQLVLGVMGASVVGGGLIWAVAQAIYGRLTAGDVSMFVAAVVGVQSGLASLVNQIAGVHQQLSMFEYFMEIESGKPDLVLSSRNVAPLSRGIEFRDVWFRYSDEHPWALSGVNLAIPHGAMVGLVGRNGSGKSTLVKLLCRFYDPTEGIITWDGVDLRDLDLVDLRNRLGAVFQDFMRYDLSAAENIGIGDLKAVRKEIETAAVNAGVHNELMALPRGYETLLTRFFIDGIDEDDPAIGVSLSGGQWQRVALARALLRGDRDLLILDEPGSGLDAEAEHEIHTRLSSHRKGRTSVLISHRLGAMREADVIAVLDGGRIAELGSHAELISRQGIYARMFSLQASSYRKEASA